MKLDIDESQWNQLMMDMPYKAPGGATREEAGRRPGNAVKTLEKQSNGMPKVCGRLLTYGDECVVLGHNSPVSPPFVWKGAQKEYHKTWEVD